MIRSSAQTKRPVFKARRRKQPTLPPAPNRSMHVEHEDSGTEACLYAVFMAWPAIQRRLNAAVIILLQWPILMTWIIALLTLGLFVYLVYALIKPEKF
jgi:K+-transporting ATPase KdpF subunit